MTVKNSDFLIVGAGIMGLALAHALRQRDPRCSIRILEKEKSAGCHASGRNSGVLHAGFYYSTDSLKARFSREGNRRMRAYCAEHGLPIDPCGKLVVATSEPQLAGLEELARRAGQNRIETHLIGEQEARELEPRVRTFGKALWSPTTASVDPLAILRELERELVGSGVRIETGIRYLSGNRRRVVSTHGIFSTGHLINAAGLYADRIAQGLGFGERYRVVPFKGLYLYATEQIGPFKRHIYPVPELRNPFLGVHFTKTVDDRVKIGPTALPALWREQYTGFDGFSLPELVEALRSNLDLLLQDPRGYRNLAGQELRKIFKTAMVEEATRMATNIDESMFSGWGRPGIRAQLLDRSKRSLVGDFVVEGDKDSTHILNAVSPAFTCAFPFAESVVEGIGQVRASTSGSGRN